MVQVVTGIGSASTAETETSVESRALKWAFSLAKPLNSVCRNWLPAILEAAVGLS